MTHTAATTTLRLMTKPVRLVAAFVVLAVVLAVAVFIHLRRVPAHDLSFFNGSTSQPKVELPNLFVAARPTRHPAWEDPVAILLSVGGLVLAAAIITVGREPRHEAFGNDTGGLKS